ncbi:AraC family transcriptional regulator [Sphingomonas alpina]|uniref:AraC family transcriptional regulator n=2 Tax=Sphingomonas alpina TaxID=653931 RepID=A0A7H0LQ86_9SPHN|nr:AraC family transcriptional regulator [Sphingomonas alpina]QNQ11839.1 AraC family transcriptional regulator [Sphingomonas alpina]
MYAELKGENAAPRDFSVCEPSRAPDLLSEVLQDLRLANATYGRTELTAPWGIDIPFKEGVRFHYIVEGRCLMRSSNLPPVKMHAGDVVLLPHGTAHEIANDESSRIRPLADLGPTLIGNGTYRLAAGGGGEPTLIVCCTIGFEGPTANPLLEMLPQIIHVRRNDLRDSYITAVLDLMAQEVRAQRIGTATIMARLADIILTHIIRTWVETGEASLTGWLAAIKDPQVGRALGSIHRDPGKDWNLNALAAIAGMSRSQFSRRFNELLKASPARYLTQWRMRLATVWIRNNYMTVTEVAAQLGYESEASFSRAFKRTVGISPSFVRKPSE